MYDARTGQQVVKIHDNLIMMMMYVYPKPIPSSLPQGSVISTSLFSLYFSDNPRPSHNLLSINADDIALLFSPGGLIIYPAKQMMPFNLSPGDLIIYPAGSVTL
jgi:hypothetical protein